MNVRANHSLAIPKKVCFLSHFISKCHSTTHYLFLLLFNVTILNFVQFYNLVLPRKHRLLYHKLVNYFHNNNVAASPFNPVYSGLHL